MSDSVPVMIRARVEVMATMETCVAAVVGMMADLVDGG